MHENSGYVKPAREPDDRTAGASLPFVRLAACVAAALALSLPAVAHAELVPGTTGALDGALALAPDGTPQVAAIVDGSPPTPGAADGLRRSQVLEACYRSAEQRHEVTIEA